MKDELLKKLDKLESQEFMLQMCDHWTQADYDTDRKLCDQIKSIKQELKDKYGWEE